MRDPRVSVLMCVYNGAAHLATAMDSLLAQTFDDAEFVIVDDGSRDATQAILTSYASRDRRVRVLQNGTNVGLTRALNRGLSACRGEYLARLDADDVAAPERLERQVAWLDRNPDVVLLGSAYHVLDAGGTPTEVHRQPLHDVEIRWQLLFHNAFCHSSVILRRAALRKLAIPGYDETLPFSQDFDLWTRLGTQGRLANLAEPLVGFRVHDDTISSQRTEAQQQLADRISAREIQQVVPGFDMATVRKLRAWYYGFPTTLTADDMPTCIALLRLLEAMPARERDDGPIRRALRNRWLGRVRSALPRRLLFSAIRLLWRQLGRSNAIWALAFGIAKS